MRLLIVAACALLATGCESWNQRVDSSRQDRCQRANWAEVGERDGVEGVMQAERYAHICGDLFSAAPYREGHAKGNARRPRPPV